MATTLFKPTILVCPLLKGPSEPKRVDSGDVATSMAMIGSQIFCWKVKVTCRENHAAFLGVFGKMPQ